MKALMLVGSLFCGDLNTPYIDGGKGCWTTEPELLASFKIPEGKFWKKELSGPGFTIKIWPGVWYSNEESLDRSRDVPGRILVTSSNDPSVRYFAAEGYKFDPEQVVGSSSWAEFEHWSGVMGCALTRFHLRRRMGGLPPVLEIQTRHSDGSGAC